MSNEIINPFQQFLDSKGKPLANGTISFFTNLTTDLSTIFSDEELIVEQNNPYTLDASGRITSDVKYTGKRTLLIKTAKGATVRTLDNVSTAFDSSLIDLVSVKNFSTLADAIEDTGLLFDQSTGKGDALNLAEHTAGFGGGAIWDVVLLSTVTVSSTIFNVIACTGVPTLAIVLRDNLGYQNVKAYGALGNNIQDDLTIFQSIVVYLASRGGGRIFIPDGNYKFKDNNLTGFNLGGWAIETSNVTIDFESSAAVLLPESSSNIRGISVTADVTVSNPATILTGIHISGGKIDGQNSLAGAVANEDSHGINIRRCENVTIKDMNVFGSRGDGIFIGYGAKDCIIESNYIDSDSSNSISGTRQGIAVLSGSDLKIINNTVDNAIIGIDLEMDDNQISFGHTNLSGILVQGNKLTGNSAEGIAVVTPLVTSSINITDIGILDNIIESNSESLIEVQVDASAGLAKKLTISGNMSGGSATFKGISLIGVKESIVSNNNLGTNANDVIQLGSNCFDIIVEGNRGSSVSGDGLIMQETSSITRNKVIVGANFLKSTNGNGCVISGAWDVALTGGKYEGGAGGLQCLGSTVSGNDTRAIINITGGKFKGIGVGTKAAVLGANLRIFSSTGTEFEVDSGETFTMLISSTVTASPLINTPIMNIGGAFTSLDRDVIDDQAVNNAKILSTFPLVNTTTEFNDITSSANTVGKVTGLKVFNTTSGRPVYSSGNAEASVWNDATGAAAHNPV